MWRFGHFWGFKDTCGTAACLHWQQFIRYAMRYSFGWQWGIYALPLLILLSTGHL